MASASPESKGASYDGMLTRELIARSWDVLKEGKPGAGPESLATMPSPASPRPSPRSGDADHALHHRSGKSDAEHVECADSYMSWVLPRADGSASLHSHWRLALYFAYAAPDEAAASEHWEKAATCLSQSAREALQAGPASVPGAVSLEAAREALGDSPTAALLLWAQWAEFKYTVQGQAEEAHTMLRQVLEWDPKHAAALGCLALVCHRAARDVGEASRLYSLHSSAFPGHASILTKHANFLKVTGSGSLPEVRKLYDRALASSPANPDTLGALAVLLHGSASQADSDADRTKQLDEAEAAYQAALESCSWHTNNLGNYGLFLSDVRGDNAAAEALYQRAIETDSRHANTLYNYGVLCDTKLGHKDQASILYIRALECRPRHPFAHYNLAVLLEESQGDFISARKHYAAATECEPGDVSIATDFATFLWRKAGDVPCASKAFARALHTQARQLHCRSIDIPPHPLTFEADAEPAYPLPVSAASGSVERDQSASTEAQTARVQESSAQALAFMQDYRGHAQKCAQHVCDALHTPLPDAAELPRTLGQGSKDSVPAHLLVEADAVQPAAMRLVRRWIVFQAQTSAAHGGSSGGRHVVVKKRSKSPSRTGGP